MTCVSLEFVVSGLVYDKCNSDLELMAALFCMK